MGRSIWAGLLVFGMVVQAAVWGQGAPARVSSYVMAGQIVKRTDPVYPPIAKAARVTGVVILRAIIDETGHVASLQVVSGPEMLREAAVEAVRNWVYRPYLLNGVATAVDTVVTVNFQIAPPVDRKENDGSEQGSPTQEVTRKPLERDDGQPRSLLVQPLGTNSFCGSTRMGEPGFHQRVSSGVMQGLMVKRVDPVYPRGEVAGAVILEVCVDAEGAVEKVRVISGPEALRDEAGRAVSEWQYRPYLLDGVAVPVDVTVTIVY